MTYTNFHTTALCSPTRSCLMTGRNHTTNGMGCITEATSGFPNANGHIPFECANIAEVLGERGWNTYIVGKWHLCAEDEMNLASSKRQWPLGRGFERYYGFLGGETNQWYPDLVYDNHPVARPEDARGGLPPHGRSHRQGDRVHPGREGDRAGQAVLPLLLPGRRPRAAPRPEGVGGQVQGQVRHGLRGLSRGRLRAPEGAGDHHRGCRALADQPVRRHDEPDGKPWSQRDRVRPWESLSDDEKRLFARMAEVYAGFLSHADYEIGRLLDYLEESGQLDNTIVVLVSDNGASGEGGPNGSVNENKFFNGLPDTIEEALQYLDELGSPRTYNHYPTGWAWAFNTPFKLWKRYSNYEGGTADPMIVSWPAGIAAPVVRRQYNHAVDIVPTIYECSASSCRRSSRATRSSRSRASASPRLRRSRGADQGDAVLLDARHPRDLAQGLEGGTAVPAAPGAWGDFHQQRWELFDTANDPSECHDLAASIPRSCRS